MSITVKSRKQKARKLQNWIAKKISKLLKIPCGKDKDIQGREMGQSGTDVKLYGNALKLFPFSIEAKWQENWSVHGWMEQAKDNLIDDTDWLLCCKRNRENPIMLVDADVFFKIYKYALKGGYKFEDNKKFSEM